VQLAAYSDRPSFFGKHFPPLWRPREDASFSLLGKGIAFLFGDLGPPLKYMMATGHRLARSYLATVARLISLVRKPAVTEKMETHASNLAYEVWSMVRPTSVISGFLKSIIHSVRLYQANMACNVDAPAASSIVNVFHVIDYAVCSIYPEFLLSSAPTEFLFEHWVFSSLHKIATHRISAIVFGYLITIAALALHARVSTQKNSLMVLTLFKVWSAGISNYVEISEYPPGWLLCTFRGGDQAPFVWVPDRHFHIIALLGCQRPVPYCFLEISTVQQPLPPLAHRKCGCRAVLVFLTGHSEVPQTRRSAADPAGIRSYNSYHSRYDQQKFGVACD